MESANALNVLDLMTTIDVLLQIKVHLSTPVTNKGNQPLLDQVQQNILVQQTMRRGQSSNSENETLD
jgi:hypothetical protein